MSEGSQQEPQGRTQSDHRGVSHSSVRARSLVKEEEPVPPSAKVRMTVPVDVSTLEWVEHLWKCYFLSVCVRMTYLSMHGSTQVHVSVLCIPWSGT